MKKVIYFLALLCALPLSSANEILLDTSSFGAILSSLPIITGLALVDSMNPCVIGVLILLLTVLVKTGNKKAILKNGIAYTAGVYATYLIGGMTLLGIFNAVRSISVLSQWLYLGIGSFVIIAGLLEVKDFFWYGRGYSLAIPKQFVSYIEQKSTRIKTAIWSAFLFGAVLTLIELPCTGAPYLAVLTLMSQSGYNYITALPLLLFYNLIFVLPLMVIIFLAYRGTSIKKLERWKKEHRGAMRLFIGIALIAIGIWIVTAVKNILLPLLVFVFVAIAIMAFIKYLLKK